MTTGALYRVEHVTTYVHGGAASTSQHVAYLTPRVLPWQHLHAYELVSDPGATDERVRTDYFGNLARYFTILTPYSKLEVTSRSLVEVFAREAIDIRASLPWEEARDAFAYGRRAPAAHAADEFRFGSPYVEMAASLADFARLEFTPARPVLDAAVALMHRVHDEFTFDPDATSITTPVTRVLSDRHGVCQDFAHLLIACLRALGLPARYVSGYLLTDPPPGQPRLVGADASHAWLAVYCPALGWLELDPTNGVVAGVRHITLAWGRDYGDVSPLRGVALGGDDHAPHVGVSVVPVERAGTGPEADPAISTR